MTTTTATTPTTPNPPAGPGTRAGSAPADLLLVVGRDLAHWRRRPAPLLVGLLFPVLTLLMFAYLFGGAMTPPGGQEGAGGTGDAYRAYLVPGVFVLTVLFGVETTASAVAVDASRGITDRFRSLPVSPFAVVGGRAVADLLQAVAGLAVLAGVGLLVGWRPAGGPAATAAAFGLLLLLRFALIWLGVLIGLVVKGPESLAALQILVWPLGFLSAVFVPPATMPGWLGTLATWNPLSMTATAVRDLFGDAGPAGTSFAATDALALAVLVPVALTAVFAPLAAHRFARLSR